MYCFYPQTDIINSDVYSSMQLLLNLKMGEKWYLLYNFFYSIQEKSWLHGKIYNNQHKLWYFSFLLLQLTLIPYNHFLYSILRHLTNETQLWHIVRFKYLMNIMFLRCIVNPIDIHIIPICIRCHTSNALFFWKLEIFIFVIFICWLWWYIEMWSKYNYHFIKTNNFQI